MIEFALGVAMGVGPLAVVIGALKYHKLTVTSIEDRQLMVVEGGTLIASGVSKPKLPNPPPVRLIAKGQVSKEAVGKTVDPFAPTWDDRIYTIGKALASMDSVSRELKPSGALSKKDIDTTSTQKKVIHSRSTATNSMKCFESQEWLRGRRLKLAHSGLEFQLKDLRTGYRRNFTAQQMLDNYGLILGALISPITMPTRKSLQGRINIANRRKGKPGPPRPSIK